MPLNPEKCPSGGSRGPRRMSVVEGPRRISGRRPIVGRYLPRTLPPFLQAGARRPAKCPFHQGPRPSARSEFVRTSPPRRQAQAIGPVGCPGGRGPLDPHEVRPYSDAAPGGARRSRRRFVIRQPVRDSSPLRQASSVRLEESPPVLRRAGVSVESFGDGVSRGGEPEPNAL